MINGSRNRVRPLQACGAAALCWSIWKVRDSAYFGKQQIKEPINVVFSICNWLGYWDGRQKGTNKGRPKVAAQRLSLVATEVFNARFGWKPLTKRLEDTSV